MLKAVRRLAGLDSQTLPTLLLRGWSVIAGAVMVLLIPIWLGPIEQGYYFTFASLLALQIFFELGMNQVIVQVVSHEFAHLKISSNDELSGDESRISRLSSLLALLRRFYGIGAALFFVIVGACGFLFFSKTGGLAAADWGSAWVLLTLATAGNLYLSPMLTVLEGCGEVAGVARMRLVQSIFGYSLMWVALGLGAGLWAMSFVPLTAVLYTFFWLKRNGRTIKELRKYTAAGASKERISWRKDIFPFQWRIAISWISGYFIFQLFTPLAFAKQGAVAAGQLGISLAIFSALLTVGMSWITAKIPALAAHVARNERDKLNLLFTAVVKRSMAFTLISILFVIAIMFLLTHFDVAAVHRFTSFPVIICLAIVTLSNCYVFAAAIYMRSHKEEPMMLVSVVSALATLTAAIIGAGYSVFTMMALYTSVVVGLTVPWTTILFLRYFRRA